jgi:hypothetical protein
VNWATGVGHAWQRVAAALSQVQVAGDCQEVGLDGGEVQPFARVPHTDERLRYDVLGGVVIARQEHGTSVDVT